MADNEMMTGYLAGKSDAGGGNGMGCGMMWPWMMGAGMGMGFGGGWGGYGGMIGEWIPLLFLAGIFGWGNNGWGGNGGGYPAATQADIRAAVDQQTLISKLDQQTYGLADTFTALNNTLNNNFRGIDNAICTLGYQNQQGFSGISRELADCCCTIERGIDRNTTQGVMNTNAIQQQIASCCCDVEKMNLQNRFDAQNNTNSTLMAIDKLGDRILGYMNDKEQQNLRDEVQAYRLAASQAKQNEYLIGQLRPCPVPAYITCNPYAASYGFGQNYGGCGCAA
jgi:hypothetical protein